MDRNEIEELIEWHEAEANRLADRSVPNVYLDKHQRSADALRHLLQAQTWRPIEEAPPMKNLLLFAVTDVGENGEVRNWKMDTGYFSTGANVWTWSGYQVSAGHIRPTHWVPLPQPPSSRAARRKRS